MKYLQRAVCTSVLSLLFLFSFSSLSAQVYVTTGNALSILESFEQNGTSLSDVINQTSSGDVSQTLTSTSKALDYQGMSTDRAIIYESRLIGEFMDLLKSTNSVQDAITAFETTQIDAWSNNPEAKAQQIVALNTAFINNLKPHLEI